MNKGLSAHLNFFSNARESNKTNKVSGKEHEHFMEKKDYLKFVF